MPDAAHLCRTKTSGPGMSMVHEDGNTSEGQAGSEYQG